MNKKKSDTTQNNTQGTLDTYISNYIVGGKEKLIDGRKRKVGAACDSFPLEERDIKRFKSTMTPGTDRRGPKSSTEEEPGCFQS